MSELATTGLPAYLVFPLLQIPEEDYITGFRAFGSSRSGGNRKHAGCDLYAPVGSSVVAMARGTIIQPVYSFYAGTYALEVDHGTFVARYGEIKQEFADQFAAGDSVLPGQQLGQVGQLVFTNDAGVLVNFEHTMLHLELYTGTHSGGLTDRSRKGYQRRADLMDPTPFLDRAALSRSSPKPRPRRGSSVRHF